MAISIGISICKTAFGIQFRVLLIPWLKKSSGIRCLSDSNSSNPVRYIPKKTLKTKEHQSSCAPIKGPQDKVVINSSDKNALRCEVSKGGKRSPRSLVLDKISQDERPVHYLSFEASKELKEKVDCNDGSMYDCMEENKEVVEESQSRKGKNPLSRDVSQDARTPEDAEKMAIGLLAKRAFTAVELRKKLNGKRFPSDVIDAVIMDLRSRGLINDFLYAETYSHSRWSSSSWGPRRIKQALFTKGVSAVDAQKAVKSVFESDDDSGGDEESSLGMSKVSLDQLLVQASKQWLRGENVPEETRTSRIVRWLQYRGFNWGIVSVILKKLKSQYPP